MLPFQIVCMVSILGKNQISNSYVDGKKNLFQLFGVSRQRHYIYNWGLNSLEDNAITYITGDLIA